MDPESEPEQEFPLTPQRNLAGLEILVSHYFRIPFVLSIQGTRSTVYVPLKEQSKGNLAMILDKNISAYQAADDGMQRAGNSCAILLSSLG